MEKTMRYRCYCSDDLSLSLLKHLQNNVEGIIPSFSSNLLTFVMTISSTKETKIAKAI